MIKQQEKIYIDTDCVSAFLWVDETSLLTEVLKDSTIIVPKEVYDEIKKVPHLFQRVESLNNTGKITVKDIDYGSQEYELYEELTSGTVPGEKIIGSGEAACIALAHCLGGTLASNNLRDITYYVQKYSLPHITTADILGKALEEGLITEDEGNTIWTNMKRKRRQLGYDTFTDYLNTKR